MDRDLFIQAMYAYGRSKALELREAASEMTDTEVIDAELFIPTWREGVHEAGSPVRQGEQVYRTIQTHDSTGNPAWNPADTPALFGVCHTKDPAKAKPWVSPHGISGLYYKDECYVDEEGTVWRQVYDGGNEYDAVALPSRWEAV